MNMKLFNSKKILGLLAALLVPSLASAQWTGPNLGGGGNKVGGSGTAGEIAIFDSNNTIASDPKLKWDPNSKFFQIGPVPSSNPTSVLKVTRTDNSTSGTVVLVNHSLELTQAAGTTGTYTGAQTIVTNANATNGLVYSGIVTGDVSGVSWTGTNDTANAGLLGRKGFVEVTSGTISSQTIGVEGEVKGGGTPLINSLAGTTGKVTATGSPLIFNATAMWARPYDLSNFTGLFVNPPIGLKVSSPGVSGAQYTMAVDTGNSYIAGQLAIGKVGAPSYPLEVNGTASAPGVLKLVSIPLNNLPAGVEVVDEVHDYSATKSYAQGDIPIQRSVHKIFGPVDFAGASNVDFAVGEYAEGMPRGNSANVNIGAAYMFASQPGVGNSPIIGTYYWEMPGIADGADALQYIALHDYNLDTYMGDQTADISSVSALNFTGGTLAASAGMRSVTGDTAVIHIANSFSAGANVSVSGTNYAILVDSGLVKFGGDGNHVFELPPDNTVGAAAVQSGRIPIKVNGATKYIRYFDN